MKYVESSATTKFSSLQTAIKITSLKDKFVQLLLAPVFTAAASASFECKTVLKTVAEFSPRGQTVRDL